MTRRGPLQSVRMIKTLIRRSLWRFGLDVRKRNSLELEHNRLALLLSAHNVDLVLDIGANTGQWAQDLRRFGYNGDIISFEPLSLAHAMLTQNAQYDQHWTVAPRVALGDHNGETEIHMSGNSVSSSILPMLPAHVTGAPGSQYVGVEKTPVRTLDSLIGNIIPTDRRNIFCKLDVQGYESKVLAGASRLLTQTIGVQMEISLAPLYSGQPSLTTLLDLMRRSEFEVYGFIPGFVDPHSGRMLQVDGVFFKPRCQTKPQ